ncbi:indole-3-glycerol phosphate synthase-domain-containing protein [Hyaloraphidium curvatum]|nr:indole-3-glycerol phosphate synthase-domain-containing protein [Hyaloraphidium curvatum]
MTTLLIDNYDSFTWNVFQYLESLGAHVKVFRNDEITVEECLALNPRNVVISPGPGRPDAAGISEDVITAFAGKVPILGVCLGEQCIYELYGGVVTYAGEIVHGKTSSLIHDGKGVYEGMPQGVQCTRYHSLAGDPATLPSVLEATSWTESKVVMGVRHKEFVIEGVQFHPESIASEYGKRIFWNFLRWEGGTWSSLRHRDDVVKPLQGIAMLPIEDQVGRIGGREIARGVSGESSIVPSGDAKATAVVLNGDAKAPGASTGAKSPSILEAIKAQRLLDIAARKSLPGRSEAHLKRSIALGLAPPAISFVDRLKKAADPVALLAEIKRASPSKGDIDIAAHAAEQALVYASGGAAAISVLTEPKWFKGQLDDMREVRQAIDRLPDRPAVLRKDFIVDQYQILEARLDGADTVLLIVAILSDDELAHLVSYARMLGMEPLVEVNNAEEMARAIKVGSKVIGVNNRNLHTFSVDMDTTSSVASMVPEGIILAALSGIASRADVEKYAADGAKAVLVGESLMRSRDPATFIKQLLGRPDAAKSGASEGGAAPESGKRVLVKICGVSTVDAAVAAAEAGADFIGLIFAKSPRQVTVESAKEIADRIRASRPSGARVARDLGDPQGAATEWYRKQTQRIEGLLAAGQRPLLVGVFSDHSLDFIGEAVRQFGLDMVQFHGNEREELADFISVPTIKALHIGQGETSATVAKKMESGVGHLAFCNLDTMVADGRTQQGGSGATFDWGVAADRSAAVPFMMAGGLTPENVADAVRQVRPWAVDVSSGVEQDGKKGVKDMAKVRAFVSAAKSVAL